MAQVQKNDDIAPSLIKAVQDAVNANVRANQRLADLRSLIAEGRATYADAAEYAREYGNMVKQAMAANVSSEVLPDGKMYWNIADRLFDEVMTAEFSEISQQCEQVQTSLNQAAGIGVKAQVPELDPEKIKGLKEYASRADQYDDVKASVENALVTYSQSIVDESVRKNADFQAKSGMHPRIIRSAAPGCCRWCTQLAGSYDYPEDTPDDVFRRHANCNCVVEYYPRDGRRQNVWTKVWSKAFKSDKEIDAPEFQSGAKRTIGWKDRHADLYYEEVRNRKPYSDAKKIASHISEFDEDQVEEIRQHMFIKEQPRMGTLKRFDPDYDQSQAWQRLVEGKNIKESDITMLRHEYMELTIMKETGCTYEEAHNQANEVYNWLEEMVKERKD